MNDLPSSAAAGPRPLKRRRRRLAPTAPDYRLLVDQAPVGIIVHRDFRILYANVAAARLYGYPNPEALKALPSLFAVIPPDEHAAARNVYEAILDGVFKDKVRRVQGLRVGGQRASFSMTERLIDWHGERAVELCILDMGEQARAEQAAMAGEKTLRALLDVLPQPIFIERQEDGKLLYLNRKSERLFGQPVIELLRGHSADFYQEADDRQDVLTLLATLDDVHDLEMRMKTSAGKPFVAELAAIRINYEDTPAVLVALNDISARKQLEQELLRQARTDWLTGINNRGSIFMLGEQELRRARRFKRELAALLIDIDHFKDINDRFGHAAGDTVLQAMVTTAQRTLRQTDHLGRLGGEEFLILLPETGPKEAFDTAERLRQQIAQAPVPVGEDRVPISVSVGTASLSEMDTDLDALIKRADAALYTAKRGGRNRVETAG